MENFNALSQMFNVVFIGSLLMFVVIFVFVIIMFVSPKVRSKVMGQHIKATRYMIDDNHEDLQKMATASAHISKEAIKVKTKAIKDGFCENNIYCKHCGAVIDNDSVYCKVCGKRQL